MLFDQISIAFEYFPGIVKIDVVMVGRVHTLRHVMRTNRPIVSALLDGIERNLRSYFFQTMRSERPWNIEGVIEMPANANILLLGKT
jgi:hypothetical protein